MSTSGSDSESSQDSNLSNYEYEYEEEMPSSKRRRTEPKPSADDSGDDYIDEAAYRDEPLADAEWIAQYNERKREISELELELQKRLSNEVPVSEWCKCGNCDTRSLQNISECYCCSELDGCLDSLTSDLVQQDLSPEDMLTCVTEHPGFVDVCLRKWSLRQSSGKYNTKAKQRYRETGSEDRFLRSIAYREFSRLIYGMLGPRRIPLPACAYEAIRDAFPCEKTDDTYTGFDLDEDDESYLDRSTSLRSQRDFIY